MKAEKPAICKTPEQARSMAERMAPTKVGVVAYSTSGDAETGDYDDQPTILFKAGRIPEQFDQ
jgi:hypothetical protein